MHREPGFGGFRRPIVESRRRLGARQSRWHDSGSWRGSLRACRRAPPASTSASVALLGRSGRPGPRPRVAMARGHGCAVVAPCAARPFLRRFLPEEERFPGADTASRGDDPNNPRHHHPGVSHPEPNRSAHSSRPQGIECVDKVVLVMDNLNAYSIAPCTRASRPSRPRPDKQAQEPPHPQHGSRINIAEPTLSCVSTQTHHRVRPETQLTAGRGHQRRRAQIDWRFASPDARTKLRRLGTVDHM